MLFHPEPDKLPFPTASERGPSLQGTSGGPLLFYGVGLTHCSRSENNNGAFYLPQQGAILVKPPGKLPTPLTIYSSPSDEGALREPGEGWQGGGSKDGDGACLLSFFPGGKTVSFLLCLLSPTFIGRMGREVGLAHLVNEGQVNPEGRSKQRKEGSQGFIVLAPDGTLVDGGRKGVRRKSTIFSGKEGFTPAGLHACMHGRQGLSQSQSPSSLNQNVRMASPQS
ncbi:hypothetical protein SUGI_1487750 [Cryptomeria japonica]|uniref:Uncharacterized protein n=1 Tax=Cryptomeria japonica TaxID=3369 RepID=A0AAD3NT80_CRYJA|nr:hypothetical protein SUGI_1487750 [Cryptomeria japonica]